MNRRDFCKLGAAAGAGAMLPPARPASGMTQGAMMLPASPGFKTRHLVTIILGCGARRRDVVGNRANAPCQSKMIADGTLFTEDYGQTANLHGYMYSEVLTGRDAPSQRPLYPTWNEYIRKKSGGKATDYWVLQPASFHGAWTWDVKHFSTHPDYGVAFGATSLTMNKLFYPEQRRSPAELVALNVESGLGHTRAERELLEAWIDDILTSRKYELPSTRQPVIDRPVQIGDCQSIRLAGEILKIFKPRCITVQVLGLDDAHADFGVLRTNAHYSKYIEHIRTTDELIGKLWADVRADPYLRETTALVIRPECGRDDEVNPYGQLGHSPGNHSAHYVWTQALGPDFRKGFVVTKRVERRDLAPTLTYLMSGAIAEHATGHVRTEMFEPEYNMPDYVLPPTAEQEKTL